MVEVVGIRRIRAFHHQQRAGSETGGEAADVHGHTKVGGVDLGGQSQSRCWEEKHGISERAGMEIDAKIEVDFCSQIHHHVSAALNTQGEATGVKIRSESQVGVLVESVVELQSHPRD